MSYYDGEGKNNVTFRTSIHYLRQRTLYIGLCHVKSNNLQDETRRLSTRPSFIVDGMLTDRFE